MGEGEERGREDKEQEDDGKPECQGIRQDNSQAGDEVEDEVGDSDD